MRTQKERDDSSRASSESLKKYLKEILSGRYSKLFDLDLTKATLAQLTERMGHAYSVEGDTKKKAVRFFLSAVSYVDLPISSHIKKAKGTGNGGSGSSRRRRSSAAHPPRSAPRPRAGGDATSKTVVLRDGAGYSAGLFPES